jgi:hypothetical protein
MKLWRIIVLMPTLWVLHVPSSFGDPITFTHVGIGTGSLAGMEFVDAAFRITAVGDTIDRRSSGNVRSIPHTRASISIAGLGTFLFVSPTRTFVNNNFQVVGFARASGGGEDLFDGPSHPVFATWDMLSPLGPLPGAGSIFQWTLSPVFTTGGRLALTDSGSPAIFTATIETAPVPEPATLMLVGLGLGAVIRKHVRRSRL